MRPIQFAVEPAGRFLAEQRARYPLLDKHLTNSIDRRGATFDRFGNAISVPTWPSRADIRFQQNPGMDQRDGRLVRPGVDQIFQISAPFSSQTNVYLGRGMIRLLYS